MSTAPAETMHEERLIRMPELMALTSLSRASVYRQMAQDPLFPKPIKIGESTARNGAVAFSFQEVQLWLSRRVSTRGA